MLTALYIFLFLAFVAGLIRVFRRRRGFGWLIGLELLAAAASLGAMGYFDALSQREAMVGWAYFSEVFSSLCAAVCFGVLTLITVVLRLLRK